MAYEGKKELGEVKEQPGSKQKVAPKDKEEKGTGYGDQKASRFQATKSDSKSRTKNETAKEPETGLTHPEAQYDTYKRPRRDS